MAWWPSKQISDQKIALASYSLNKMVKNWIHAWYLVQMKIWVFGQVWCQSEQIPTGGSLWFKEMINLEPAKNKPSLTPSLYNNE